MAETDVIAKIYPFKDDALYLYAQKALETSTRLMPPANQQEQDLQHRNSRESTADRQEEDDLTTLPFLEVRFSDAPRTSTGLVFGTDRDICDVVLPDVKLLGMSKRHFALTYKNQFADGVPRLIVRDLGSKHGTIVAYSSRVEKEPRSGFDWIIDGFSIHAGIEAFIVQLHDKLKFQIVVTQHDIQSPAYANNVHRFRQGATSPQDLLDVLGLRTGPETERNTGTHTPGSEPILLPLGKIGKGGFGVVTRHWNVSTGEEYACKQPVKEGYDRRLWEKEINIMRGISHDHIVRLCEATISPWPTLYLEYMAFGNLTKEHKRAPFSEEDCITILHQSASALKYLHERAEPVAHRDIKPDNILVQQRNPLRIKLSDFGLSKIGDSLRTGCVSPYYCPPEIDLDSGPKPRYTRAVDIWSLGVVILRFAYGLPPPWPHGGPRTGMEWCNKVVQHASDWDSDEDELIQLLQRMVVINPEYRCSSADCWSEASRLLASYQGRSTTPTPASHAAGGYVAAARPAPVSTWHLGQEPGRRGTVPYEQYPPRDTTGIPHNASVSELDLDLPSSSMGDDQDDGMHTFPDDHRFVRSNGPPPGSASRMGGELGGASIYSGRSGVAESSNQHAEGWDVNNTTQRQGDMEAGQQPWTDSEEKVAAALLRLTQAAPAQQPGFTELRQPWERTESSVPRYDRPPANTPRPLDYAAGHTQIFAPLPDNAFSQSQLQAPAPSPAEQAPLARPPISVLVVPAKNGMTYWGLQHEGGEVMYRPHDGLVNVTQLVRAQGYDKGLRWTGLESKMGLQMRREVVKGGQAAGTYASMDDAERILRHLQLGTDVLADFARQIERGV